MSLTVQFFEELNKLFTAPMHTLVSVLFKSNQQHLIAVTFRQRQASASDCNYRLSGRKINIFRVKKNLKSLNVAHNSLLLGLSKK